MGAENLDKKWTGIARRLLVGRRIVEVGYMTREEAAGLGWSKRPLVIVLDDGMRLFAASDDEGNDGGSVYTTDKRNPILPVL